MFQKYTVFCALALALVKAQQPACIATQCTTHAQKAQCCADTRLDFLRAMNASNVVGPLDPMEIPEFNIQYSFLTFHLVDNIIEHVMDLQITSASCTIDGSIISFTIPRLVHKGYIQEYFGGDITSVIDGVQGTMEFVKDETVTSHLQLKEVRTKLLSYTNLNVRSTNLFQDKFLKFAQAFLDFGRKVEYSIGKVMSATMKTKTNTILASGNCPIPTS